MTTRDASPTASALEVALADDDLTLKANECATTSCPKPPAIAVDNAAFFGSVQNLSSERWVGGNRLEAIDGFGESEIVRLEVSQQFDTEFDGLFSAPDYVVSIFRRLSHSREFRRRAHNGCRKTTRRIPIPPT